MELTFSELRAKEVVNTQDGRKLGRVCDIVLCYPENRWLGIVAPNGRAFGLKKNNLFIDLKSIVKIGEDVILVNVGMPKKPHGKNACSAPDCPPPSMPPSMPPHGGYSSGRSFEEYE
jgi:YlmC/YmxH family sporulation protein